MLAFNQEPWTTEQDILTREDELNHTRISRAEAPDPDDEEDLEEDDDLDLEDDDLDADDDIVPDYDEDLDEDDLDDEDDENYDRITGEADTDPSTGIPESYDNDDEPNEIPEQGEADNEDLRYPNEDEVPPAGRDDEGNFSEQIDVTPPTPHEMPSVGRAETDFTSRPHGRTTGRMLGHEPGTENI
ncbi:hypothetical protein KHS38_04035 [Mucilaginibacter sp. Bleaf8]|uniref:hypothetical protein n=1 Tax=Mucilaginibacter sp. Bleaf8 TaxID=2834430 RepID=UPI001BCDD697|nr:hypothetical protein [Mucilaginibacter sp. Bleaf8]MBS7563567.1 hypothetical protein [Mucilaginibacter sp. Bleaf8]